MYQKGFETVLPSMKQQDAPPPSPLAIQAPAPAAPAPAPADPNPSSTAAIAVVDAQKKSQLAIQNSQSSASNAGLNTGYLVN